MNFFKKILAIVAAVAAIMVQTDSLAKSRSAQSAQPVMAASAAQAAETEVEEIVTDERKKVEKALIDNEKIKTAAMIAIDDANQKYRNGEIDIIEKAKIIGEQNYKIEQADNRMVELTNKSEKTVKEAKKFLRQAGEYVGYLSTDEQIGIAEKTVIELRKDLEVLAKDCENMVPTDWAEAQRYTKECNKKKQEIESAIQKQESIINAKLSPNEELFWKAVGLVGVAAGTALAAHYLGKEVPVVTTTEVVPENLPTPSAPELPALKPMVTETSVTPVEQPINIPSVQAAQAVVSQPESTSMAAQLGDVDISQIEPTATEYLNQPELSGEKQVKDVVTNIGKEAVKTVETAKQKVGEALAEHRHNENPLTGGEIIDKAKGAVGSVWEGTKEVIGSAWEKAKEFFQAPAETEEAYRARVAGATSGFEREAAAQAERAQQLQLRTSPEEQEKMLSELGEQLSERGSNVIEAGKAGITAGLTAPQYRDEDVTGGAIITPEMAQKGIEFGEKVSERVGSEEPVFGRSEIYEGAEPGEESGIETLGKALEAGATAPINPESGI